MCKPTNRSISPSSWLPAFVEACTLVCEKKPSLLNFGSTPHWPRVDFHPPTLPLSKLLSVQVPTKKSCQFLPLHESPNASAPAFRPQPGLCNIAVSHCNGCEPSATHIFISVCCASTYYRPLKACITRRWITNVRRPAQPALAPPMATIEPQSVARFLVYVFSLSCFVFTARRAALKRAGCLCLVCDGAAHGTPFKSAALRLR